MIAWSYVAHGLSCMSVISRLPIATLPLLHFLPPSLLPSLPSSLPPSLLPSLPPSFLARRGYEHLNVDTELRNGDILTLVLDDPNMYLGTCGTEYGKKTYNPVVPQSDMGLSKFFSILKFIVSYTCICGRPRENQP